MRYFTHKFFGEPEGIPARQVKVRIPLQVCGIGVEVVFTGTGAAGEGGLQAWQCCWEEEIQVKFYKI